MHGETDPEECFFGGVLRNLPMVTCLKKAPPLKYAFMSVDGKPLEWMYFILNHAETEECIEFNM